MIKNLNPSIFFNILLFVVPIIIVSNKDLDLIIIIQRLLVIVLSYSAVIMPILIFKLL